MITRQTKLHSKFVSAVVRRLFVLIVFICISCNIYAYDWFSIADSIANCQKRVSPSWCYYDINRYMLLRKYRYVMKNYTQQINTGDTIIFMEHFSSYKDELYVSFWIKGKPDSYLTYDKNLNINKDIGLSCFSYYSRMLCNKWDVSSIRKEEHEHPIQKDVYIMATRVILQTRNNYKIECVFFKQFYDFQRDNCFVGRII